MNFWSNAYGITFHKSVYLCNSIDCTLINNVHTSMSPQLASIKTHQCCARINDNTFDVAANCSNDSHVSEVNTNVHPYAKKAQSTSLFEITSCSSFKPKKWGVSKGAIENVNVFSLVFLKC